MTMFLRSIAVGGGESFYAPSAMSLLASCHKKTRSLAFSIHQAALYFGLMMSGVLAAKVLGFFGSWRAVFVAFGLAGLVLGLVFIFALREVPRDVVDAKKDKLPLSASFKAYFTNPSALLATTGFIAIVCVNNAYLTWAPKIFAERFGVDAGAAGSHTMFYHHLVAFVAILIGGWLTDRFVRVMPRFRLALQILSLLCGAVALLFIGRVGSYTAAVVLTAAYGLFRGLFEVNTHASVFDVISSRHHASVVGFMLLLAMFTGALFAGELIGRILERFDGAEGCFIVFALMAFTYFLAALLMSVSFFFTFKKDLIVKEDTGCQFKR
jgi:MFS family permease